MEQLNTECILLNIQEITSIGPGKNYEIVIDENMNVMEAIGIEESLDPNCLPVATQLLVDRLFVLNHVRINPYVDNTMIVNSFTNALKNVGIKVKNKPTNDSIAICYKPIGELSNDVRLRINNNNELVLMSSEVKLKIIK